ncbi:MAG: type II secretion system protein GspG [Candidatus Methylomirabilia bacterium]
MRRRKFGGELGISLLEMIVVLAVIGLLLGAITPMVISYVEDAKREKAEGDVKVIGASIIRLTRDVGHFPIYTDGTRTTGTPDFDILQGPGNDPIDNPPGNNKWFTPGKADDLEDHLIKNAPGTTPYSSNGRFRWRGPYLEKITEDPWGNRYLVNIGNANPADSPAKVVWTCSAGPDGTIDTDPDSPADSGPAPGGDDICSRLK